MKQSELRQLVRENIFKSIKPDIMDAAEAIQDEWKKRFDTKIKPKIEDMDSIRFEFDKNVDKSEYNDFTKWLRKYLKDLKMIQYQLKGNKLVISDYLED